MSENFHEDFLSELDLYQVKLKDFIEEYIRHEEVLRDYQKTLQIDSSFHDGAVWAFKQILQAIQSGEI